MALTVLPYSFPLGVPLQSPVESSSFLIPAGTINCTAYLTAHAAAHAREDFAFTLELWAIPREGLAARKIAECNGRNDGTVAGHGSGLDPGDVPTGVNFTFVPENSGYCTQNEFVTVDPTTNPPDREPLANGTVRAFFRVTALGGSLNGSTLLVAGVARCEDIDGNEIEIDVGSLM